MAKNLDNQKQKKSWFKILSWSSLAMAFASGIVGIGFGIANFIKFGSKNLGVGYTDSLQTKLQFSLPSVDSDGIPLSDEKSLEEIEKISNKLALIAQAQGVDQIQIQSGIEKDKLSSSSSEVTTIGNVYWHTNKVLLSYDFGMSLEETENETSDVLQARLDNLKLIMYFRLSQNYSYYISDSSSLMNNNIPESNRNNNFTTNFYKLNNALDSVENEKITKAYNNENKLMFDLRPNTISNPDNKTWDLSVFQKQFTNVYSWDGSDSSKREDIISQSENNPDSSVSLSKPNISYIFYRNRSGLITLLQNLTTIAALNENTNLDSASLIRANRLYETMNNNNEYAGFMRWSQDRNVNGGLNWYDIMSMLYDAEDYDINETITKDPLMELLNSYYTSSIFRDIHNLDKSYNDYEFLYSWNFDKTTSLINQYLVPIDYHNWFKFFEQDATEDELKNNEYVKETYLSKKINTNWAVYDYSLGSLPSVINLLNTASINTPATNFYLTKIFVEQQGQQAQVLYNAYFNGFIDSFITSIPGTTTNSITGIHPFIGAIIGLSSSVILIGIIVSILYRIPGLLMAFSGSVSFALTLLLFSNLNITFAITSVFAIAAGIITMFFPFFFAMKAFKKGFQKEHLNLNNAFKKGIISFVKSSIIIFVSFLIIGLSFLFFGIYQIQSFGAALTLIGFTNFICCFLFMLALFALLYFVLLKTSPHLMFNNKDVLIINKNKKNRISFDDVPNEQLSKIDLISNKISSKIISYHWPTYLVIALLLILSIIGLIILLVLGPRDSLYFTYSNQISLVFRNEPGNLETAREIANQLSTRLGLTWLSEIYYEQIYNGYSQLLLVPRQTINNVSVIYTAINEINSAWLFNTQVLSISTYFPMLLSNNSIKCLFIAFAFLAIFNIFMFNLVNVIPIFIMSLANVLLSIGFIGLFNITLNLNTSTAFNSLMIISQLIIIINFMNMKMNYDMKQRLNKKELLEYSLSKVRDMLLMTLSILGISLLISFIMILFESQSNILNYLIIFIGVLVVGIFTVIVAPFMFTSFMIIREWYLSKVLITKNNLSKKQNAIVYDKVDEQIIVGINHS